MHVPFCARRCSYCDFAIAVRRTVPVDEYLRALEIELALRTPREPDTLDTVYLGGGTPSRLGPAGVNRLLALVRSRFRVSAGAEVTLEANPEDISPAAAGEWRAAGVTRVSLGVQSFNDDVLRWMHRTHDAATVESSARALADAGFDDWTLDLIFALPREVVRSWHEDLSRAIDLGPPHLSCYGLTVEPHTPLVRWRDRGHVHEADEECYESEFLEAHSRLTDAGYAHYEVSNYARPGRESRHNSAYWQRVPYLGFGPSAHSFDGHARRWNAREYADWGHRLDRGEDPVAGSEDITNDAADLEEAYLALRTRRGVAVTDSNAGLFDRWRDQEWADVVDGIVRLAPRGWLRLDSLVAALTGVRSRY